MKFFDLILIAIFLCIIAFINPRFVLVGLIGLFLGIVNVGWSIARATMNHTRDELIEIGNKFMKKYDELVSK